MTSLCNLLRGAVAHHAGDGGLSPRQVELRGDFEARLPERLAEIKRRWKTLLVIHRNAYLAHRDLAKLDALPEMTYLDIRAAIDLAQTYYASFAHAYQNQGEGTVLEAHAVRVRARGLSEVVSSR